jgi:hypothetical protein
MRKLLNGERANCIGNPFPMWAGRYSTRAQKKKGNRCLGLCSKYSLIHAAPRKSEVIAPIFDLRAAHAYRSDHVNTDLQRDQKWIPCEN